MIALVRAVRSNLGGRSRTSYPAAVIALSLALLTTANLSAQDAAPASLGGGSSATAQQDPGSVAEIERVIVTGSNIPTDPYITFLVSPKGTVFSAFMNS